MTGFTIAFAAAIAAVQQPVPSINYSLPGQVTPAPPIIPADAEVFAFQPATVLTRPSASARHYLLAATPSIPSRGLAFTVRCLLDRANGRVMMCRDATVPEPYRAAAVALGSLYQFQLTPAQIAAVGPLVVTIPDRIVASDVRPAARLFTFTTRPAANVTFAAVMTGEQSQAYYPRAALDVGLTGRVRIDCQVQPDLSLFCLNPMVAADSNAAVLASDFQLAALQLSGWLRAAPALANGAPAPGTIFRTTIIFNVPQ